MKDDPQEMRLEVTRLLAEAKSTADEAQKKSKLARAVELATKAEVLEIQRKDPGQPPDSSEVPEG
jgi:hypothetical protein